MKKGKLKKLIKLERNKVKKKIQSGLVIELKQMAVKLGQDSKKLDKEIEKGSKNLANKIIRKIRISKSNVIDSDTSEVLEPENLEITNSEDKATVKKEPASKKTAIPSIVKGSKKESEKADV